MSEQLRASLFQVLPFVLTIVLLFAAVKRGRISRQAVGLCTPGSWVHFPIWIVFFSGYSCIFKILLFRQDELLTTAALGEKTLLSIVCFVVLSPLTEELLLRGVLLSLLAKRAIPVFPSLVIQSLLSVALHASAYDGTGTALISILGIFTGGMLYGIARNQTGSLLTPVCMHVIANGIILSGILQNGR